MLEQPVENGHLFEQGKLGGTVASFMEYLFMDNGSFNVSGINIEQFTTNTADQPKSNGYYNLVVRYIL